MEKVILTNMCMILDEQNQRVVIINRIKNWVGNAFPGGHVLEKEPIVASVIREVKEETNLDILNPTLVAIRDYYIEERNERTVSFLFVATEFKGSLKSIDAEGEVFWAKISELKELDFAEGFKDQLDVFFKRNINEVYSYTSNDETIYKFYKR